MNLNEVMKRKTVEIALRRGLYKTCSLKIKGKTAKIIYASISNVDNGLDHYVPLGVEVKIKKNPKQVFDLVYFHPLDIEEHAPTAEQICKIEKIKPVKVGRIPVRARK